METGRVTDIPDRIHKKLIETIVKGLANKPLVLKGGTSLMLAYGLDRYSEDIDYDSNTKVDLPAAVHTIMQNHTRMDYAIRTKKHTDTTSRIFVDYSTEKVNKETLKIEVKNNLVLQLDEIRNDPGFLVYSINHICQNKIDATTTRIKPRDLYDLAFIARHHAARLNETNLRQLEHIAENKPLQDLYEPQWNKDRFVRKKPFNTTIALLKSVKAYVREKEKGSEYDMEL